MVTGRGPSAISTGVGHFEPRDARGILRGVRQGFCDQFGVGLDLAGRVVRPRPEEAAQTVTFGSRHNVYVQVRYRLTHHIVDRYEGALRTQRCTNRRRNALCHGQQRNHEIARKGEQILHMASWSDEHVTLEHRSVIKEGDHPLLPGHYGSIQLTAHNLADHIAHRHETNAFPRRTDCGRRPGGIGGFGLVTCCFTCREWR
jgi:hypothetical protein